MQTNSKIINPAELKFAPWRATYTLKPDLKLLRSSIEDYGLLSPLVVQSGTGMVIDGHHRLACISSSRSLTKTYSSGIQCVTVDVDEVDAMVMHVRLNRARGLIVAKYMSGIVKKINQSRKYSIEQIDELFNMTVTESELMLDGSLVKMRKIKEHTYSPAWVPIEAAAKSNDVVMFEKPPNGDR